MDRKTEIRKDLWQILCSVYVHSGDRPPTTKQDEFLDKVMDYLDDSISLRRKQVKEKPEEKPKKQEYINPDKAKFDS